MFITRIHRLLSKSRLLTLTCAKIRNQADAVIGAYLGESGDSFRNGEYALLELLAPLCSYFVDVGANRGEWVEQFLRHATASGSLFEPSSGAFSVLAKKFENSNLSLHNQAVGDRQGTVLFIEEPGCGETSSVAEVHNPCAIPPHRVSVCTIDSVFYDENVAIDYLKIDAEGYDFKVLLGANKMLKSNRIRFIQFEYNSSWTAAGHSLKQSIAYLTGLGYEVFIIRSTGLHPINYKIWGDYYRYSNFFSCALKDRHKISTLIGREI